MRSMVVGGDHYHKHVVCTNIKHPASAGTSTWFRMNIEVMAHPPRVSRWRNGLAHWTSNSKVAGSSPARDESFFFFFP